ncbi:MAG: histidine kinase N-terminal 7TM domain-containing protein [Pseudomonadales bacterium]|nr:histidine kinase N-terminal 7TM domain-containing protein [Pseudomonadales bacterium]
MQVTLFSLPSLGALLFALVLLPRVWRQRAAPGGWHLTVLLAAIAWWAGGQALGTLSTSLDGKFLAAKLQYPGIVVVPTAWFLFCLRYTGELRTLYANWPLLLPIPAVTLAIALSNEFHGWLWAGAELVRVGSFVAWEIDYGPWFAVHRWWSYLLIAIGTLALLRSLLASPWHRRRALLVIAAPVLALAANLVYLAPDSPVAWLDLTPAGFVAAGAAFTLALRGDLLDLVPLSRERVVLDMADAVFVLGADGRVIDMNPAGARLAGRHGAARPGRALWELLPIPRATLEEELGDAATVDLLMTLEGEATAWRVSASALTDPRGEHSGRVLIFHETTEHWRTEQELRAATEALGAANRELTRLVTLDPLTRALQRGAFLRQTREECARARRSGRELRLLTLRLENLAQLNATAGSEVADQVLRAIARLLESMRRDGDLLGRTGAAEFALLMSEASAAQVQRTVEELQRGLQRSRFRDANGRTLPVCIRHGVAALDEADTDADTLLSRSAGALEAEPEPLLDAS